MGIETEEEIIKNQIFLILKMDMFKKNEVHKPICIRSTGSERTKVGI